MNQLDAEQAEDEDMLEHPDRDRLRAFTVSEGTLTKILNGRVAIDMPDPWPEDATIVRTAWEPSTWSVACLVRSREFDRVPDGHVIPSCGPLRLRTVHTPEDGR